MNSNHINTLIHIGAGTGQALSAYLESGIEKIILIEPIPELADALKEKARNNSKVEVWECAVTTQSAEKVNFIEHNLIETSSLHPAFGLQKLYPGLKITRTYSVNALTPEAMINNLNLCGSNHELIIEANGEEGEIVSALAKNNHLGLFSKVTVTLPSENLYQTDNTKDAIETLTEDHFDITNVENSDPDFPEYHFSLNKEKKKNKELESSLTELKNKEENLQLTLSQQKEKTNNLEQQLNTCQQELTIAKESQASLQSQLAAEQQKLTNAQKTAAEEKNALHAHIQSLEQEKSQLNEQVKLLQEQLASFKSGGEAINALKQQMEHLFQQQTLQLEQAANALGKHVTRTAHSTSNELKAFAQIQQTGAPAHSLEYAGQSLPPAQALQISRLLQQSNYDLVIQLGSGVDTLFIAEALKNSSNNNEIKMLKNNSNATSYDNDQAFNLPKPVVTFEANRAELKKLEQELKQHNLNSLVETQFAPLVDYQLSNINGLFPDIKQPFQHIANLYQGRTARILVLITPDEATPASYSNLTLPLLLQFFATHSLDLLLNTASEAQQSELHQNWSSLLESRGFEHKWHGHTESAPRALLQINP